MYISSVNAIQNVRNLEFDSKIAFCNPLESSAELENINVIVGENGSGKTSLLRAIVAGLLGDAVPRGYARGLVRRGARSGSISLTTNTGSDLRDEEVEISERGVKRSDVDGRQVRLFEARDDGRRARRDREGGRSVSPPFVAAYGATRWSPTEGPEPQASISGTIYMDHECEHCERESQVEVDVDEYADYLDIDVRKHSKKNNPRTAFGRVVSLFQHDIVLQGWFDFPRQRSLFGAPHEIGAPYARLRQIFEILNDLLQGMTRVVATEANEREIAVVSPDNRVLPLELAPGGIRSLLGWAFDLLIGLSYYSDADPREVPGIVLIDELDLHLHPKWQMQICQSLSATFPKIQFFITTHSPLVVSSVGPSNIWVMNTREGVQVPVQIPTSTSGDADEILRGPWFSLHSTRPLYQQQELRELAERARNGDLGAADRFLAVLAGHHDWVQC